MEINSITMSFSVVVCAILLDFILGVLLSIKKRTFNISILPYFIYTNIFPYVGGMCVILGISMYIPEFEYLFYAAAGMASLKFSKEALLDKTTELFLK